MDRQASHRGALSSPTRARLFQHLAAQGRPVSAGELAGELRLHPSGVRVHLERLRQAGLVTRERLPVARGRPRHGWQVSSEARPGVEPPDAYRQLATLLARSIPPNPARLREVERTGRELGRELALAPRDSPAQAMGRTLTALGFAPRRRRRARDRIVFELGSCPYRDAVRDNQPVICALHRGLTRGLIDELAPSARLAQFVPHDPDRAGCLIEVSGLEAPAQPSG